MGESFVDVTYRGLEVGRRVRLHDVAPASGYLDVPMPMPVGTALDIVTDDGVRLAAVVARVHEQVAGSELTPGMRVRPALDVEAARAWWSARVTLTTEPADAARPTVVAPPRPRPATTPPRSRPATTPPMGAVGSTRPTATTPPPTGAITLADLAAASPPPDEPRAAPADVPAAVIDPGSAGSRTTLEMSASALREALAAADEPRGGNGVSPDQTQVMAAVELSALGLQPDAAASTSKPILIVVDDSADDLPVATRDPLADLAAGQTGELAASASAELAADQSGELSADVSGEMDAVGDDDSSGSESSPGMPAAKRKRRKRRKSR